MTRVALKFTPVLLNATCCHTHAHCGHVTVMIMVVTMTMTTMIMIIMIAGRPLRVIKNKYNDEWAAKEVEMRELLKKGKVPVQAMLEQGKLKV